jgi:chaperonin cofactor prefoldin
MKEHIRERRDTLAAQLAQGKEQFTQLEQTLHALDRQLCAMQGGLRELDALLEEADPPCDDSPPF